VGKLVFTAWLLACLVGLGLLWRYKTTPGADGDPPARWPAASVLARTEGRATLVMLVHPRCACSKASLDELNAVMQDARDVDAYVVFDMPEGWAHTSTWERAQRIRGVTVVEDRGGVESARFRVAVSGHTLLYDAAGTLRFSGGITGARGHAGDNAGRQQLVAALRSRVTTRDGQVPVSDVFGCRLFDPGRESL
jgi:hypothetical protein